METIREKNSTYWSWRAEGYSSYNQQELEDIRRYNWKKELEDTIREQIPGKAFSELKVLDIGTGPGFFAILMSELGAQVTALDFTREMLEEAKKNAGQYADTITWIQADAQNPPFAENQFDVLLTRNVTWNLPDPVSAYESWLRVMKVDGMLLNYDANWYQYLFDDSKKEAYDSDRVQARAQEVEDCNVGDGFEVMEEIAREIPLGKELRPVWDQKVMDRLGYSDIELDTKVWERVWSEDEKISCASTPMFRIIGRKRICS